MSMTRLPTLQLDAPPLSTFHSCVQLIDAATAGEIDSGTMACIRALAGLGAEALGDHLDSVEAGESAYGPVLEERPWLRRRVRGLQEQAAALRDDLESLRECAAPDDPGGAPLRSRVRTLREDAAGFRRADLALLLDARRDTPALD